MEKVINCAVLIEMARRWEEEAVTPEIMDGSPGAELGNAVQQGQREAKRECADGLKMLVDMLGRLPSSPPPPPSQN